MSIKTIKELNKYLKNKKIDNIKKIPRYNNHVKCSFYNYKNKDIINGCKYE